MFVEPNPVPESSLPSSVPHKVHLKICGMREPANMQAVAALGADFMGFIFYAKSPRYVGPLEPALLHHLPPSVLKVGVFVDASLAYILEQASTYALDLVQLHGSETPEQCAAVRATGIPLIKAFGVGPGFDFEQLAPYVPHCSYFLFDTKGPQPGGNGTAFDWTQLQNYALPVPYFLAGGIDLEHAEYLRRNPLPGLFAVDLNSRFEAAPGLKNVPKLSQMICRMKNINQA